MTNRINLIDPTTGERTVISKEEYQEKYSHIPILTAPSITTDANIAEGTPAWVTVTNSKGNIVYDTAPDAFHCYVGDKNENA